MRKQAVFRIRIITGLVLLLAILLVARLYQIQILHAKEYQDRAKQQYVHTVIDLYDRGSIFFTTKDGKKIAGATVKAGYVMAVDPSQIKDPESTYEQLKSYLEIDQETFITRATLPNRTYVEVEQNITDAKAEAINELSLVGVQLFRNRWRYYPGKTLAARAVGFVGFAGVEEGEESTGRYGLERYYEQTLARKRDRLSVNFFAEIFSNLGSLVFENSNLREGSVVTSLEPTVSRILQKELLETNDKWDSNLTGGIVMNPKTGAIYALDAVPTFDLNERGEASVEDFQNPLVENVYEFGSIVKPLTVAAGLDSGSITANTTYYDSGQLELDTFTIGNFDGRGRGTVDMQEVLNQSLNTGVAFIVDKMGKERFRDYFLNLQLGSETGVDLPGEAHGLINNLSSPRDVEYATASFGQGIALTPIAMTRALAALGNGGRLVTPHLASEIEYAAGDQRLVQFPEGEAVWSEDTSEEISRMLVEVVDEALRDGTVIMPRYSIAAKTGTAQIADPEAGGYYEDRFLHSFFGYFPAYDPEFLVFLYTVEPKEVRYASETLTDPFMNITKFLINYYNLPPDR